MSDGDRVVYAAKVLDVSEFELFERAYSDWYGREPETLTIEHEFVQYLYFGAAPPWVRHYARMTLDAHPQAVDRTHRRLGMGGALLRLMDSRVGRYLLQ